MPEKPEFLKNPLAAIVLLMAAHTPDPVERINNFNQAINSMKEAVNQINAGLTAFNTEVLPMFVRPKEQK